MGRNTTGLGCDDARDGNRCCLHSLLHLDRRDREAFHADTLESMLLWAVSAVPSTGGVKEKWGTGKHQRADASSLTYCCTTCYHQQLKAVLIFEKVTRREPWGQATVSHRLADGGWPTLVGTALTLIQHH